MMFGEQSWQNTIAPIVVTQDQDQQMPKYVLSGHYCEDVLEKRAPYRQAHLEGLAAQKAAGTLITLGPTQDLKRVFGIYDADSEATVRALIEGDPYWQQGIWTDYEVHEWIQAI
jgi:uncharacterized protein